RSGARKSAACVRRAAGMAAALSGVMARLDATAMWFERGEDEQTLAATEFVDTDARRVPTLAWVAGGVTLAALAFGAVILFASHASASRRESSSVMPAATVLTRAV